MFSKNQITKPTATSLRPAGRRWSRWSALLLVPACLGGAYYIGAHRAGSTMVTADEGASAAETVPSPGDGERAPASPRPVTVAMNLPPKPAAPAAPEEPSGADQRALAIAERDFKIRELRASGPDRRNLATHVNQLLTQWKEISQRQRLNVTFGELECSRIGCFVGTVQDDQATADSLAATVSRTHEFMAWNGSKMRSGPIQNDDGRIEVTWMVYGPPEGEVFSREDRPAAAAPAAAATARNEVPAATSKSQ